MIRGPGALTRAGRLRGLLRGRRLGRRRLELVLLVRPRRPGTARSPTRRGRWSCSARSRTAERVSGPGDGSAARAGHGAQAGAHEAGYGGVTDCRTSARTRRRARTRRAAVHAADPEEADVERVLVGADLGHAAALRASRQPQQLRDLASWSASAGTRRWWAMCRLGCRFAQQAQHDRDAGGSARTARSSPRGRASRAPRRGAASSDTRAGRTRTRRRGSPVRCLIAISHSLSRRCCPTLPCCPSRCVATASMSASSARAPAARCSGCCAQRRQDLLLALELLQEVGLEVGARRRRRVISNSETSARRDARAPRARRRSARARTGPRGASACGCARSAGARSGSRRPRLSGNRQRFCRIAPALQRSTSSAARWITRRGSEVAMRRH